MMNFSESLIKVRAKLNLTQAELGKKLHVTLGTISRWENGKVQPTKKAKYAFEQFCKDNNIELEEKKQ